MQISLKELRQLVKETLSETYFGASNAGNLASTAFNKVGPSDDMGVETPMDPVDLANQIRALIGGDAGFPLQDWGDESFNAAAEAAADALINNSQRDKTRSSVRLYEQKKLIHECIEKTKSALFEEVGDIRIERISDALATIVELLTSMDKSLDLVYGAVSGYEGPIGAVSGLQRYMGRHQAALPKQRLAGRGEEQ